MVTSRIVVDKIIDQIEKYRGEGDTILDQQLRRLINYIDDPDAPWFDSEWCEGDFDDEC